MKYSSKSLALRYCGLLQGDCMQIICPHNIYKILAFTPCALFTDVDKGTETASLKRKA